MGNGRLAAMLLGEKTGRLALNHEDLYRGVYRGRRATPVPSEELDAVRSLLLDGKFKEGTELGNRLFAASFDGKGKPLHRVDPYQPAGDFGFTCLADEITGFTRTLFLEEAAAETTFLADGVPVTERCFVSQVGAGALYVQIRSERPTDWRFSLTRREDPGCRIERVCGDGRLTLSGQFEGNSCFMVCLSVDNTNGRIGTDRDGMTVACATEIVVSLNIGVGDESSDPRPEAESRDGGEFDLLFEKHLARWRERFSACGFDLTVDDETETWDTDKRIAFVRNGGNAARLPVLYFHYGRYLLLSSTGRRPANLQGKWNEEINPPWDCDYHYDINLQMNYWMAEPLGMSELTEALFSHCEAMIPSAHRAARDLYGCRGILFPLLGDGHGDATPEAIGWGAWIGAAAWMAQFYRLRYEYGQDPDFLAKRAYPFFKEIAEFFEDYLIRDDAGTLRIVPSQSPENRFVGSGDSPVSLCVSSAMDLQLCYGAFLYASEAAEFLGVDEERRQVWRSLMKELPKPALDESGTLLEWEKPFEEREPGHRHFSPLVGIYPVDLIREDNEPALFKGAEKLFARRLSHGGGHTGWSRAWSACLAARFGNGNEALAHLDHLIADFSTVSLLDLHPPAIFQIDGNLGGTAAIAEMLFRSEGGILTFLPALPDGWTSGFVRGFRARGGFTVSFDFHGGVPKNIVIRSAKEERCRIACPRGRGVSVFRGRTPCPTDKKENVISFAAEAGETYQVEFAEKEGKI